MNRGPATPQPQEDTSLDLVSVDESRPLATRRWWWHAREFVSNWLGLLGILAFFLAWELASRAELLNPFYFPPFSKIVAKGIELFINGSI